MKKLITTLALAGILFASVPASAGNSNQHNYDRIRAWIAESAQWRMTYLPTVYQGVDVFNTANFNPEGAATLERTRNGIKGSIMSNVAMAGEAYTLWVMVINNAGACTSTPCSIPDILNPDTETSAHNGGGAISASNGKGGGVIDIQFETVAGPLPDGLFALFGAKPGLHRGNGFDAEVWLVIDSHDAVMPGDSWLADLTTTDGDPARNHRIAFFTPID